MKYTDVQIEAHIDCGKSQLDATPTERKGIEMLEQCYKDKQNLLNGIKHCNTCQLDPMTKECKSFVRCINSEYSSWVPKSK